MVTITPNTEFDHVVLVVDDNPQALDLLALLLNELRCKAILARDGLEALQIFEETEVDMILTDLNMPFMDGNELLFKVRARDQRVPVVCVTAKPVEADPGFNRVMKKPYRIDHLKETVSDVFKEHKIVPLRERKKS